MNVKPIIVLALLALAALYASLAAPYAFAAGMKAGGDPVKLLIEGYEAARPRYAHLDPLLYALDALNALLKLALAPPQVALVQLLPLAGLPAMLALLTVGGRYYKRYEGGGVLLVRRLVGWRAYRAFRVKATHRDELTNDLSGAVPKLGATLNNAGFGLIQASSRKEQLLVVWVKALGRRKALSRLEGAAKAFTAAFKESFPLTELEPAQIPEPLVSDGCGWACKVEGSKPLTLLPHARLLDGAVAKLPDGCWITVSAEPLGRLKRLLVKRGVAKLYSGYLSALHPYGYRRFNDLEGVSVERVMYERVKAYLKAGLLKVRVTGFADGGVKLPGLMELVESGVQARVRFGGRVDEETMVMTVVKRVKPSEALREALALGGGFNALSAELAYLIHPQPVETVRVSSAPVVDVCFNPPEGELELGVALDAGLNPAGSFKLSLADLARHGYILGGTGSGKTTLLAVLAYELAGKGLNVLVLDFTGQLTSTLTKLQRWRVWGPGLDLKVNVLRPVKRSPAEDAELAADALNYFTFVSTNRPFTAHKKGVLRRVLREMYEEGDVSVVKLVERLRELRWRGGLREDERTALDSLLNELEPLTFGPLKGALSAEAVDYEELAKGCNVVDLSTLRASGYEDGARLMAQALLRGLLNALSRRVVADPRQHVYVLIDEAQNVARRSVKETVIVGESAVHPSSGDVVNKVVTEGRKHGLSLVMASPTPLHEDVTRNANFKAYFKLDSAGDAEQAARLLFPTCVAEGAAYLSSQPVGFFTAKLNGRTYYVKAASEKHAKLVELLKQPVEPTDVEGRGLTPAEPTFASSEHARWDAAHTEPCTTQGSPAYECDLLSIALKEPSDEALREHAATLKPEPVKPTQRGEGLSRVEAKALSRMTEGDLEALRTLREGGRISLEAAVRLELLGLARRTRRGAVITVMGEKILNHAPPAWPGSPGHGQGCNGSMRGRGPATGR